MKKVLLVLLAMMMLVIPAYAAEGEDDPTEEPKAAAVTVETLEELQQAVAAAEDGAVIEIEKSIKLLNTELLTDKDITLLHSESLNNAMFIIGGNVTISGFAINSAANKSAEILADTQYERLKQNDEVKIENCTFCCETAEYSRIISAFSGNITILNCSFDASGDTAVNINASANVIIDYCTFKNCETVLQGGAICNYGILNVANSLICGNQAGIGGAIYNAGTVSIESTRIYGNNVTDDNSKDLLSIGNLTILGENQEESSYYNTETGEKLTLPIQNQDGFISLAYLTTEQAAEYFAPEPEKDNPEENDDPEEENGENTPETPQEPEEQDKGKDTADDDNTPQEPSQGGTGDNNDGSEEQEPEQPEDQGNDDPADPPQPETPLQDDTIQDDDGSDDDYTPPVYRPSRPSIPIVTVNPEPEQEPQPQPENDPAPAQQLVCGEARIDTSRTIVLLGYGDGQAHEEEPLTRAQMAAIVYRLLDDDTIARYSEEDSSFADIAPGAWYAPFVQTIYSAGIVNGVGGGNYNPDGLVTWAQIIVVLSRFVEPQDYDLQYIQYDGWAQEAIQTAAAYGWIEDSVDFEPDAVISRGELVQLVNGVMAMYR